MLYRRRVIPPSWKSSGGSRPGWPRPWRGRSRTTAVLLRPSSGPAAGAGPARDVSPSTPRPLRSIAAWVRQPAAQALRVAEINRIDGLHDSFSVCRISPIPSSTRAEPGAVVEAVRYEDLTRLTYADASFDLVLTLRDPRARPRPRRRRCAEIRRVLVPGGRHLFTVPLLPGVAATFARTIARAPTAPSNTSPRRSATPAATWAIPSSPSSAPTCPRSFRTSDSMSRPTSARHRRRPGPGVRLPQDRSLSW